MDTQRGGRVRRVKEGERDGAGGKGFTLCEPSGRKNVLPGSLRNSEALEAVWHPYSYFQQTRNCFQMQKLN